MKIGIVIGSIREGRLGASVGAWVKDQSVGAWVKDQADKRADADYRLLDLKEFRVPLLESPTHPMQANKQYDSPEVTAWSRAIDACDGFVFVPRSTTTGFPAH